MNGDSACPVADPQGSRSVHAGPEQHLKAGREGRWFKARGYTEGPLTEGREGGLTGAVFIDKSEGRLATE
jgi:hypothetical protein